MSGVTEKMARAMYLDHWGVEPKGADSFETTRGYWMKSARAALKVVAEWEPSEGTMSVARHIERAVNIDMSRPLVNEPRPIPTIDIWAYYAVMSVLKREAGL